MLRFFPLPLLRRFGLAVLASLGIAALPGCGYNEFQSLDEQVTAAWYGRWKRSIRPRTSSTASLRS